MKKLLISILLINAVISTLDAQVSAPLSLAKNYGYTSGPVSAIANVRARTQTNLIMTPYHVYYVGVNHKVCDYNYTGTNWTGGGQLEWGTAYVYPGSHITNDGDNVFFIGTDYFVYGLNWNSTTGWNAAKISTSQTLQAYPGNDFLYCQDKLFYIATSNTPSKDRQICSFTRSGGIWTYGGTLNNNPLSEPVADGTKLIPDGPTRVFYIGKNTHRIHNFYNTPSGWVEGVLNSGSMTVANGSDIVYDGTDLYYIGTDNKIYRMYWNSGWISTPISQANALPSKNLTYFNNKIYYEGTGGIYAGQICYVEKVSSAWTGIGACVNSFGAMVKHNSAINIISNPIFNEGSTTSFFNSDQISYMDINNRVTYEILDYPLGDELQPLKWHCGYLNNRAPYAYYACSELGYRSDQKRFFYMASTGYLYYFTRKITNDIARPGLGITFSQEFNSPDPGLADLDTNWNTQWPWGSGPLLSGTDNQISYHNYFNNCSVAGGNLSIASKQETGTFTEWGAWAGHQCIQTVFNYTSGQLFTGVQNEQSDPCGVHKPTSFAQDGGIFEARMKIPRAKYAWPAFWFWPDAGAHSTEIDFELGGNGKWLLCNSLADATHKIWVFEQAVGYRFYDDFYTYAIDVNSGSNITWLLNNERVSYLDQAPFVPVSSMYMLLQQVVLDRGNSGAVYPNQYAENEINAYPNYLLTDYIRVYQRPKSLLNIQETESDDHNLNIYPNPGNGVFTIELDNSTKTNLEVYDMLGNKVKEAQIAGSYKLDLTGYSKGVYMIKMIVNNKPVMKKIIVE